MLKVNNLSYSFPQKTLYENISFELVDNQHCAFIGPSGIGKTTLVDIIMNPDDYSFDGTLDLEDKCKIAYVSQFSEVEKNSNITVFDYIGEEFIKLERKIDSLCSEMETSTDIELVLEKYQEALDLYESLGGSDYENIIKKKLNTGNLFKLKDSLIRDLSGGEFKLIQIIKEMIIRPDLLIMDEPDVFLDYNNLNSLKDLINSHKGIILVITHNRYLLNHCFNKILHLENKEIQEFDGRYIEYNFNLLNTKIELQELSLNDDLEIQRNEAILDRLRFIASENADAARGKSVNARAKIQERLMARRVKAPFVYIREPKIKFNLACDIEETIAIDLNSYSLAFEESLLENVSLQIKSTDKVALVGENGSGKTSLLRDIYENNNKSIKISDPIKISYLCQNQGETLNLLNTISDEFFDAGLNSYDSIRSYISSYGFDEDLLDQRIDSLSGGEKNLLQLAKIGLSDSNFLLLDEPTSHLDTYSQIALEDSLKEYKGGFLMVSHDYYTIANCVDYVLLIEDKNIRKISNRKFRKMIYENHFNKDYIEIEQRKKSLEVKIEKALKDKNFEYAKTISEDLEKLIDLM